MFIFNKIKVYFFNVLCFLFISKLSYSQDDLIKKIQNNGGSSKNKYQFSKIIDLETTSVKNQAKSGTCWSYGIVALLENEIIRKGGEKIDLSEMYIVKNTYIEKADRYVRLNGNSNFSQGGANTDLMDIVGKYGIVPQNIYQGLNYGTKLNNHYELEASLKGIVDAVKSNKGGKISTAWKRAYIAFLEEYLGKEPKKFDYENQKYTPKEFSEKIKMSIKKY